MCREVESPTNNITGCVFMSIVFKDANSWGAGKTVRRPDWYFNALTRSTTERSSSGRTSTVSNISFGNMNRPACVSHGGGGGAGLTSLDLGGCGLTAATLLPLCDLLRAAALGAMASLLEMATGRRAAAAAAAGCSTLTSCGRLARTYSWQNSWQIAGTDSKDI
jgi:hypothetical protein